MKYNNKVLSYQIIAIHYLEFSEYSQMFIINTYVPPNCFKNC